MRSAARIGRCNGVVSIPVLVVGLAGVVACIGATIAFVAIFFHMQTAAEEFVNDFADGAVESTYFLMQRHFLKISRMSLLAQRVMTEHHAPYPADMLHHMLQWFARDAVACDVQYIVVDGLDNGFRIGRGILLPGAAAFKDGYCSVSNISSGHNVTAGFYRLDNFEPEALVDMITVPRVFNFTAAPWSSGFRSNHVWSNFYLGPLSEASAIAIGGPFVPRGVAAGSGADDFRIPGAYSLHDFTEAIVAYFRTLKISKTGAAILIDAKTRAFVGGNIVDKSVMGTAPGPLRLALLEDLADNRIAPVVAAAGSLGAGGSNALLTCKAPCRLVFRPSTGTLVPHSDHRFSLFTPHYVVRVVELTDAYGLSMRLMFVLPSDDFCAPMRRGALLALIIPAALIVGILIAVFFTIRRVLKPLSDTERLLLSLTNKCPNRGSDADASSAPSGGGLHEDVGERSPSSASTALTMLATAPGDEWDERNLHRLTALKHRSVFSEIGVIQAACTKLTKEMAVFRSFLGHSGVQQENINLVVGTSSVVSLDVVGSSGAPPRSVESDVPRSSSPAAVSTPIAPTIPYVNSTLWNVPVTTVVANVANFEHARQTLLPSALVAMQARYLSVLQDVVKGHGGVVAAMYGDRVWVHFNAMHRVVLHAAAAARMVLAAEAALWDAQLAPYSGVCFGIATANGLCGVMGSSSVKVFTVVGDSTGDAAQLMWQAKVDAFPALMSWRTAKLVTAASKSSVVAQNVRLAKMPHDGVRVRTVARPLLVERLRNECFPLAASLEEARRLLHVCNEASDYCAEGNLERAVAVYQSVDALHLEADWLANLVHKQHLEQQQRGVGGCSSLAAQS